MSHNRLNVTLTRTSNEFLAPRLPLDGEIELWEIGTHQHLIGATVFREVRPDGTLAAPVEVRDVAFTYTQPGAQQASERDLCRGLEELIRQLKRDAANAPTNEADLAYESAAARVQKLLAQNGAGPK